MYPKPTLHVNGVIIAMSACLAITLGAVEEKKIVQLESHDGRKITAELLEKDEGNVKLKTGSKIYTLPLSKLSKESVEAVKNAQLPTICNFKLEVDFNKRGTKISSSRDVKVPGPDGKAMTVTEVSSYRVDTITGKVTVKNLDLENTSPAAKLYLCVLCNGQEENQVIHREEFELSPIGKTGEVKFETKETKTWHTPRGEAVLGAGVKGRYSGYIVAIVIDGRIAEIKSSSPGFEENPGAARALLQIRN